MLWDFSKWPEYNTGVATFPGVLIRGVPLYNNLRHHNVTYYVWLHSLRINNICDKCIDDAMYISILMGDWFSHSYTGYI